MQVNGLGANRLQVWLVGKVHPWHNGLVRGSLLQAMQHAIQVRAAVGERLLNGLVHQLRWILLM